MVHIVQNKRHVRVEIDEKGAIRRESFEVGDAIEPTESELSAFPDRFRRVPELGAQRATRRAPTHEGSGDAT